MAPQRISLPLGMSYPTVNAWLITEPDPVLIDCGLNTPASSQALAAGLAAHGLDFADLTGVFVTHPHVDHVGLAGVLAEAAVPIWLSEPAHAWLRNIHDERAAMMAMVRRMLEEHGFPQSAVDAVMGFYQDLSPMFSEVPEERVLTFALNDRVSFGGGTWEVVWAPGHSDRQVCFFRPETGELFSGDMLLPKTPVPVIEPEIGRPEARASGLPALLQSYNRFRSLDIQLVYPGHGGVLSDAQELIDRQTARIQRRMEECLKWVQSGVHTLPELLNKMYRHLARMDRLGGLAMLVGYLDVLMEQGRVVQIETNGILQYFPADASAGIR